MWKTAEGEREEKSEVKEGGGQDAVLPFDYDPGAEEERRPGEHQYRNTQRDEEFARLVGALDQTEDPQGHLHAPAGTGVVVPRKPMVDELAAHASVWQPWTAAFVQRLRELGWIEGRTITIEYRWALEAR